MLRNSVIVLLIYKWYSVAISETKYASENKPWQISAADEQLLDFKKWKYE